MSTRLNGFTFSQVPVWATCDPRISDGAHRLLTYLVWRQGNSPNCWPKVSTIAGDMHTSEKTIRRRIDELERQGYLLVTERPGTSNLYHIIADPEGAPESYTPDRPTLDKNDQTPRTKLTRPLDRNDQGDTQICPPLHSERESCDDKHEPEDPIEEKKRDTFEQLFGEAPARPPAEKPGRTDPAVRAARISAAHDAYLKRQRAEGADAHDDDRARIYPRAGISAESLYATHRTLLDAGVPGPSSDARWKRWRPMLVSMYQEAAGDQNAVRAAAQLLVAKMGEGFAKDIGKWADYVSAARLLAAKAAPTHHPDHARFSHPDTPDMTGVDDTDRVLAELGMSGGAA